MAIDRTAVEQLAGMLADREGRRRPGPRPSADHPGMDVADAYRVQQELIARRVARTGERVVGHKIGATNPVVQRQFGVDTPDFGHLLSGMMVADGGTIDVGELIAPRVEAEIAFVLGATLAGPDVGVADVMAATTAIAPALEIIDTRIDGWDLTFVDTVADNGSSARAVVGDRFVAPTAVDLRTVGVVLEIDGQVRDTGAGAASLGHPARAVAWLARALSEYGQPLRAGHIVLSGSLTATPAVAAGNTVRAHFGGLGSVGCAFYDGAA
ncbi:2-keto-4-pentenoate hydratase [Embleya sp. AB8]|uniref:2-keto-4-pentenoate hydratase n=1 Tax=Embleya sp. AB8 TaxID=3156304 RepID=UPI003C75CC9E